MGPAQVSSIRSHNNQAGLWSLGAASLTALGFRLDLPVPGQKNQYSVEQCLHQPLTSLIFSLSLPQVSTEVGEMCVCTCEIAVPLPAGYKQRAGDSLGGCQIGLFSGRKHAEKKKPDNFMISPLPFCKYSS